LYPKVAGSITTHKDASAVALAQVKAHIDAGKAVIAGVNIPAVTYAIDKNTQPVADHFIDILSHVDALHGRRAADE